MSSESFVPICADSHNTLRQEPVTLQPTTQVTVADPFSKTETLVTHTKVPSSVEIVDSKMLSASTNSTLPKASDKASPTVTSNSENGQTENIPMKLLYTEYQWSPSNPEGKKQYHRDFLIQMQTMPLSLLKPVKLPNLDIIKHKARIQRLDDVDGSAPISKSLRPFDPFMPTYAQGNNVHKKVPTIKQKKAKNKQPKKNVLPNEIIKLHESENTWKPSDKVERSSEEYDEEQVPTIKQKKAKNKQPKKTVLPNEIIKLHESEDTWKPSKVERSSEEYDEEQAYIQRLDDVDESPPISKLLRPFDPFMPTYAQGNNVLKKLSQVPTRKQKKVKNKQPKKTVFPNKIIKLHESENPWKPSHKVERSSEEYDEEKELFKRIRGILNKITVQKFEIFVVQMKLLPINTIQRMEEMASLIYERAINEPLFSVVYANMCRKLALMKVPVELDGQQGKNSYLNLRKVLHTKCQREFEQYQSFERELKENLKAIKAAEDEENCKNWQMEFDDETKKLKVRMMECVRFIGQLYMLHMLTEPIMHIIIKWLLSQSDEEILECLCLLLTNAGEKLKVKQNREFMDSYLCAMQKIVDKRLTSSRVRFLLQDVVDFMKRV